MSQENLSAHSDLEIETGAESLSLSYLITRFIFRLLFLIILILALFGFFGGRSQQIANQQNDLQIKFEKYVRIQAEEIITLNINTEANDKKELFALTTEPSIQNYALIKRISPQPIYEVSTGNTMTYYFKTLPQSLNLKVIFVLEPYKPGFVKNSFTIQNSSTLTFDQFIYP